MCVFEICASNKILSFSHSLSKNMNFLTTTSTTSSFFNFNQFFCLRYYFFNHILSYRFTIMCSTNTPFLCHLIIENHIQKEHSVEYLIFFLGLEKLNLIFKYIFTLFWLKIVRFSFLFL